MANSNAFENQFKVRLISAADASEKVVFDVSPTVSVSAPVEYSTLMPIHMPGALMVYKNTNSRTFSLSITLISRTSAEATKSQYFKHLLSAWRYPYFGKDSSSDSVVTSDTNSYTDFDTTIREAWSQVDYSAGTTIEGNERNAAKANQSDNSIDQALQQVKSSSVPMLDGATVYGDAYTDTMLGAPPPVLYFYAYSGENNDDRRTMSKNINRIPVVLTQLEYSYPNNVDYIPTLAGEPWPIKMELTLSLTETRSPRELENFSLSQYKAGRLPLF